jgi:hypothetical protein
VGGGHGRPRLENGRRHARVVDRGNEGTWGEEIDTWTEVGELRSRVACGRRSDRDASRRPRRRGLTGVRGLVARGQHDGDTLIDEGADRFVDHGTRGATEAEVRNSWSVRVVLSPVDHPVDPCHQGGERPGAIAVEDPHRHDRRAFRHPERGRRSDTRNMGAVPVAVLGADSVGERCGAGSQALTELGMCRHASVEDVDERAGAGRSGGERGTQGQRALIDSIEPPRRVDLCRHDRHGSVLPDLLDVALGAEPRERSGHHPMPWEVFEAAGDVDTGTSQSGVSGDRVRLIVVPNDVRAVGCLQECGSV